MKTNLLLTAFVVAVLASDISAHRWVWAIVQAFVLGTLVCAIVVERVTR